MRWISQNLRKCSQQNEIRFKNIVILTGVHVRFVKIIKTFRFDFIKLGNFPEINHMRSQGEESEPPEWNKLKKLVLYTKAPFLAITFQK